jgi:hypothetical protein
MPATKKVTPARQLSLWSACSSGAEWAGKRTWREIWHDCPRGDWLIWLAVKAGVDRRLLILCACACARRALVHVKPGEDRPRLAIEAAELCTKNDTPENRQKARAAAYAASAAYAAYASAAYAAASDAAASDAAAYAAASDAAAADDDARVKEQRACADAVRSIIGWDVIAPLLGV